METLKRKFSTLSVGVVRTVPHRLLVEKESTKPFSPSPFAVSGRGQVRGVAQISARKFVGSIPGKKGPPKLEWYRRAEQAFLKERSRVPDGFVHPFTQEDLAPLPSAMTDLLHLRCASSKQLSRWRKQRMVELFQQHFNDYMSGPVRIAVYTEQILNLRRHMLQHKRDHEKKMVMTLMLNKRQRAMKALYTNDFELYKHVCKELKIRMVRFAIPDSRHPTNAVSPMAVDGDRCRFLIRMKLWKGKFRPRPVKERSGKTARYTRHPIEEPPPDWNKPKPQNAQISRSWPYGVKEERMSGNYPIHNPTKPGHGHIPVPILF
uniref:Ribosomal protein S15 n=1 Tax=Chromera velia CCMP2878 TaxID=1169474 RepID=A0A0G4HHR3_9ALVE|eukprot:Cvel_1046.t1-p1 / transcript=Cvel_1046.t1 / gene=Cvel_1046 / organism=Chromera_velia_CCMP2878 / gene_product=30S ribosomal protein S15, putative / transcript_product=30S ribosomal protein S15, putative / location=Cvel_scaffold34:21884-22837(+) / protein_length=318 / sequence_SO=supercontig / SO=protein_coding / is_pseudo=false